MFPEKRIRNFEIQTPGLTNPCGRIEMFHFQLQEEIKMKKVISKIGVAAMIASMGALLFTGCDNSDVSGRTLSREDYRAIKAVPGSI